MNIKGIYFSFFEFSGFRDWERHWVLFRVQLLEIRLLNQNYLWFHPDNLSLRIGWHSNFWHQTCFCLNIHPNLWTLYLVYWCYWYLTRTRLARGRLQYLVVERFQALLICHILSLGLKTSLWLSNFSSKTRKRGRLLGGHLFFHHRKGFLLSKGL